MVSKSLTSSFVQKVERREKLAQKVGRREIYPPVPPPSGKYHFTKYCFAKYHFAKYRFAKYHFVSFRFVSQSTISQMKIVNGIFLLVQTACLCFKYHFAEYHLAKYRFAKYHLAKYHFAKYHFAKYVPFRKVPFGKVPFRKVRTVSQSTISQSTISQSTISFRFVSFRFAKYGKPFHLFSFQIKICKLAKWWRHMPEPDDNFRTYKINDRPSRFIVSLHFHNKWTKTRF